MNTMKKTYRIEGLDCANCAAKIEGMISKLAGVNSSLMPMMKNLRLF